MSHESGVFSILHLSDIHATQGNLLYGQIDGLARVRQVGDYVLSAGMTPEVVLVTGDLAERGHSGVYPEVKRALQRLGDRVGAPVLTVLGNHDSPTDARALAGHEGGHYRSVTIGEARFLLLDSSGGALGAKQLRWLKGELETPSGSGTIIALHHPPVASPLPTLSRTGLRDASDFAEAIADSDVRIVLAGHYHHPMSATVAGIPVSVGPSLAYHQVMNAGPDSVSGHNLAMFSLVQLTDGLVSTAPVSLYPDSPLFTSPAPQYATAID
ncbi:metallophosphoesterase family protein [Cryobacterium aureum]|uniref:metallophosphoesterase family protein n=1 Tax=Cryobacterium aureum TaxID=995037 RepID=UPI000CF46DD1|nr:metallophosphoesterase [Cryobacterium aureum]